MNYKNLGKWSLGSLLFVFIALALSVHFINKKDSYLKEHSKTSGNMEDMEDREEIKFEFHISFMQINSQMTP